MKETWNYQTRWNRAYAKMTGKLLLEVLDAGVWHLIYIEADGPRHLTEEEKSKVKAYIAEGLDQHPDELADIEQPFVVDEEPSALTSMSWMVAHELDINGFLIKGDIEIITKLIEDSLRQSFRYTGS